jgi:mannose-6-phosphate isomerase-like protein (cupin superfamily)
MQTDNKNDIIREKVSPGYERIIAHLDNLMVTVCDFTNGPMKRPDPPHSHPHEQITYVAEGELLFLKSEVEYHLKKGDIITVPSGTSHCIQTLSDHVILVDSFQPLRKEFLKQIAAKKL